MGRKVPYIEEEEEENFNEKGKQRRRWYLCECFDDVAMMMAMLMTIKIVDARLPLGKMMMWERMVLLHTFSWQHDVVIIDSTTMVHGQRFRRHCCVEMKTVEVIIWLLSYRDGCNHGIIVKWTKAILL